ncbi:Dirigent protein [Rhynchospora pubera]|uniref:Dirigent protein n=1 Tax=Rhynchospora pubera TaxID=906938 RepID=A0AAV8APN0_9POAL|nr:Dirigent protein [Rhynchospora pubera]KAJ4751138.1 Dirigent protein [Rhynchospora pubera]
MESERYTRKHRIPLLLLPILLSFNLGTTIARPVSQDSDRQITFYITGTVPLTAPHTKPMGLFEGQSQIDQSTSFLTSLTPPHALEAGKVKFINQQLRGVGDIGTPLIGQVEGVQVTSLGDSKSSILALEASFASITGETKDSLRFFGVRHADAAESQIAVVGGKGKYEEVSGFAVIKGGGGPESSGNDFGFTVYLE